MSTQEVLTKFQSSAGMRRIVSDIGLRNVLIVPFLATLSSTVLTVLSLLKKILVTRAIGHLLRLA